MRIENSSLFFFAGFHTICSRNEKVIVNFKLNCKTRLSSPRLQRVQVRNHDPLEKACLTRYQYQNIYERFNKIIKLRFYFNGRSITLNNEVISINYRQRFKLIIWTTVRNTFVFYYLFQWVCDVDQIWTFLWLHKTQNWKFSDIFSSSKTYNRITALLSKSCRLNAVLSEMRCCANYPPQLLNLIRQVTQFSPWVHYF